ncbi:winged helix-turn-helix domain-containing protein [Kribbella sp. NPDC050281]|uniref:winged helix-turn-helix domain-containing protein n=1 Tax=Kribbella sp. NPDC050281 TaxID=3155515 RepID=UPI0034000583
MDATAAVPVVVCIASSPEERSRLAAQFDGIGVLVVASDPTVAGQFLRQFRGSGGGHPAGDASVVRVGGLRLDDHEATWHGVPLSLTPHELKVLACLAERPGRIWTYQQLHDRAWDGSYFTGPAAVQSVIKRLRAKLRQAGVLVHIDAARGLGFRLVDGKDLRLIRGQ